MTALHLRYDAAQRRGLECYQRLHGGELADFIVDLLVCHTMCNDLATVGINCQMQLSPATSGPCSVLFFQSFACASDIHPGAVYQNVNVPVCNKLPVVVSG
jgi:hypothetical protein